MSIEDIAQRLDDGPGILVRTPIQSMSMSGSAAETCSARNVSKSAGISVAVIGTETPLPKLGT